MAMITLPMAKLKDAGYYIVKDKMKNPEAVINQLLYVDFLAQNNAADVSTLELPFEDGELKLTKSEITRLFFGHIDTQKQLNMKPAVLLSTDAQEQFKRSVANVFENIKSQKLNAIEGDRATAEQHLNQANRYLLEASKKRMEMDSLRGVDPMEALRTLQEGLPSTNWDFDAFESYSGTISFVNRSDVMLVHKDLRAGFNYELNCGRFRAMFTTRGTSVKVLPFKGCVSREAEDGSYIHPHISTNNSVCWGNAADSATKAIIAGDILKILQILDALLPNYGAAPYQLIEDFKRSIENRDERLRGERDVEEKAPQWPGEETVEDEEPDWEPEEDSESEGDNSDDE